MEKVDKNKEICYFYYVNQKKKGGLNWQCHLDKDDTNSRVCRNTYPALFL